MRVRVPKHSWPGKDREANDRAIVRLTVFVFVWTIERYEANLPVTLLCLCQPI